VRPSHRPERSTSFGRRRVLIGKPGELLMQVRLVVRRKGLQLHLQALADFLAYCAAMHVIDRMIVHGQTIDQLEKAETIAFGYLRVRLF
jgi:hypothetical protein